MQKSVVVALLALLAVAAVSGQTDYTYVSNQSSRPIRGTTSYSWPGKSQFVNRLIPPKQYDYDEYSKAGCGELTLSLTLWVDGAKNSNYVNLGCNWSVVGLDNADKSGVNIYYSVDGNINEPTGYILITIYP